MLVPSPVSYDSVKLKKGWGETPQWLECEFTDHKVRGSNPTSASRLALSGLGQPGIILALVLPSGGMAVRHRKGATAERFGTELCTTNIAQLLRREPTDQKVRGSNRTPTSRLLPARLEQSGWNSANMLPSGGVTAKHRKIRRERLAIQGCNKKKDNRSTVTPFRCLAVMPSEGSTKTGILPGCPSLDRGGREAGVGFEPRTFRETGLAHCRRRTILAQIVDTKKKQLYCTGSKMDLEDKERESDKASMAPVAHALSREVKQPSTSILLLDTPFQGQLSQKSNPRITKQQLHISTSVASKRERIATEWLRREITSRKVQTHPQHFDCSWPGQATIISALLLHSGGTAARHRNGVTPEQLLLLQRWITQ
ncbi:hypothetical protein CSKR_113832 [Clonorchis sinensis]|uniref:Uncharacterized protein n=1 Tax=Clonorchis sinensis TaxID=79923 RepID=A0A419PRS4_CLOSI|nr:hypothetical protein CSKR_113832 [Clonorchis sinensis]